MAPIYQQEDRSLMQTNLAKQLIYQKRFGAFRRMGEHCASAGNVSLDSVSLGCGQLLDHLFLFVWEMNSKNKTSWLVLSDTCYLIPDRVQPDI